MSVCSNECNMYGSEMCVLSEGCTGSGRGQGDGLLEFRDGLRMTMAYQIHLRREWSTSALCWPLRALNTARAAEVAPDNSLSAHSVEMDGKQMVKMAMRIQSTDSAEVARLAPKLTGPTGCSKREHPTADDAVESSSLKPPPPTPAPCSVARPALLKLQQPEESNKRCCGAGKSVHVGSSFCSPPNALLPPRDPDGPLHQQDCPARTHLSGPEEILYVQVVLLVLLVIEVACLADGVVVGGRRLV
jgi:hypothetical protein